MQQILFKKEWGVSYCKWFSVCRSAAHGIKEGQETKSKPNDSEGERGGDDHYGVSLHRPLLVRRASAGAGRVRWSGMFPGWQRQLGGIPCS